MTWNLLHAILRPRGSHVKKRGKNGKGDGVKYKNNSQKMTRREKNVLYVCDFSYIAVPLPFEMLC